MFNLIALIKTAGYMGVFGIIFAESGLLVGFFLPGDSLLFTAGLLASEGYLNIALLLVVVFIAAVVGDSVGYFFGKKVGPHIFNRPNSLFFNQRNVDRTSAFFSKHGRKSIILARFMPVVRTFVPVMAGVGEMKYSMFITYNLIGAFLWAIGVTLLGYFLGKTVPNVDHYLLPIIVLIIVVSLVPSIYHILKDPESRAQIKGFFKQVFRT